MSKPQDFFGASPKTVLNKPFFHAQDQKAYNVDGGTSIADAWTKRTLNTVIHNDIQGASLASDQVSLPAGTYYVEANSLARSYATPSSGVIGIFKDSALAIQGCTSNLYSNSHAEPTVSGIVTLASSGVIDLRYYFGVAEATTGLGHSNNTGSITNPAIPSIYADLKIWQLDRSLEIAPKAVNSGLQTIAGMNTEGGIMGGDVTVSGNTLTISKCSCMSSDLTTAMATTSDSTVVLPGTVNQDFYIFMVRLVANGSFVMQAYTTYAGPTSDVLVDKFRFVSYAKNNGSGVTMPFKQVGDRIDWLTAERPIVTSSVTSSYASYSLSSILPISVLKDIGLYVSTAAAASVNVSYDGSAHFVGAGTTYGESALLTILPVSSLFIKCISTSTPIKAGSITLRR